MTTEQQTETLEGDQRPWKFNVDPHCAKCGHLLREHRGHLMSDPCGVAGCRCEYACYQPKREAIREGK